MLFKYVTFSFVVIACLCDAAPWSKSVKTMSGSKSAWAPRDFEILQEDLENGVLLPPSANDEDAETWSKSMNFVEPPRKPAKILDLAYYGKFLPFASKKVNYPTDSSSHVTDHSQASESTVNPITEVTHSTPSESLEEISLHTETKDVRDEKSVTATSSTELPKTIPPSTTTTRSIILARDGPIRSPPVWSPPLVGGVMSGSLFKFPSNEEFDRSQGRYTDSFMHGHALEI